MESVPVLLFLFLYSIVSIIFGFIPALIAKARGKTFSTWWFISWLLLMFGAFFIDFSGSYYTPAVFFAILIIAAIIKPPKTTG